MMNTAPYYSEPQARSHTSTANGQLYDAQDESYDIATSGLQTAPMFADASQGSNLLDEYSTHTQHNLSASHLEGNPHLAELLAAAAKAGVQEAAAQSQANNGKTLRRQPHRTDLRGEAQDQAGSKRKRTPEAQDIHGHDGAEALDNDLTQSARKRTKHSAEVSGADSDYNAQSNFSLSEARAAGVHSAAALFRRPSNNPAKKYTRPPMSKLFTSLQLTPENFLHLQAAAKQYMLDPTHPDRQSCVGNRGKGDTDMVKLRLFNCVRAFLDDGIGDRFFGPNVPAPTETEILEGEMAPGRKWIWPRDGNKIVSLVTPLLRRMVTNERQRQYAIETRKGGGAKKKDGTVSQRSRTQESEERRQDGMAFQESELARSLDPALHPSTTMPDPPPFPEFDTPHDAPQHQQPQPDDHHTFASQHPQVEPQHQPDPHPQPQLQPYTPSPSLYHHPASPLALENTVQILLTKHNVRLLPRLDLVHLPGSPYHTMSYAELMQRIREQLKQLGFDESQKAAAAAREELGAGLGGDVDTDMDMVEEGGAGGGVTTSVSASVPASATSEAVDTAAALAGEALQHAQSQAQPEAHPRLQPRPQSSEEQGQATGTATEHGTEGDGALDTGARLEIRAVTGAGLVLVKGEREWEGVKAEVGRAVWMEGVLKVVVEVL